MRPQPQQSAEVQLQKPLPEHSQPLGRGIGMEEGKGAGGQRYSYYSTRHAFMVPASYRACCM